MRKNLRFYFILPFFILCLQNKTIAQCWNNGDLTTYDRLGWDQAPASTALTNNFSKVYNGGSLLIGGGYQLAFTNATAVTQYLPTSGTPRALTASLQDPTDASAGVFGGNVLAAQLDVDFSDANVLTGNSNVKFGDLVLYGFTSTSYNTTNTDLTTLNGLTVRQYLVIVNALLGGGSSRGFSGANITDLDPVTYDLSGAFNGGTPSTFAQQHLKKGWKSGDFTTYDEASWGDVPNGTNIASLLNDNYDNVYAATAGVFQIGTAFSLEFTDVTSLLRYLPAGGVPAPLNATLIDPTTSPSGIFGGNIATLKLNIDFSDANLLPANSGLKFGDLVLYNLTTNTDLNGVTLRGLLNIANTALGGGSTTDNTTDLNTILANLNASFGAGTVGAWAQLHLKRGWQNGDLTSFDQTPWGAPTAGVGAILQTNYSTLYASTFGITEIGIPGNSGFSMQFDVAKAVFDYLPSIGTPAALTTDYFDPLTSNSGQFGGDVLGLKLNIDFSDAGLLPNNSGLKFGDLTICGLTSNTDLNGLTVRQFLSIVNTALGGGTTTDPISDLDAIAIDINNSFSAGLVSTFTQLHLVNGSCDCGNTVTNHCPTAATINVSTTVDSAVKFILQGSDADNNTLTYTISQSPTHGNAVIAGGDSILYTPNTAYHGTDQLKYTVSDGQCSAEAVVNITVVVCPGGQGYWKNNQSAWPVSSLMLGTNSYSKSQLITILNMAIGNGNNADASLILADQLIGAKLSLLNGSPDPGHLADSIAAADALIGSSLIPMKVKANSVLGKKMISLATFLSNYNNGALTQGCTQPMITMAETQDEIEQIPGGYRLEQNYPNPFGNGTIIQYELPVNSHVRLEVFNLLGEKVATIVDENETAGYKTVQFNASNRTNGVYYYRLTADKFSETKKMILVK